MNYKQYKMHKIAEQDMGQNAIAAGVGGIGAWALSRALGARGSSWLWGLLGATLGGGGSAALQDWKAFAAQNPNAKLSDYLNLHVNNARNYINGMFNKQPAAASETPAATPSTTSNGKSKDISNANKSSKDGNPNIPTKRERTRKELPYEENMSPSMRSAMENEAKVRAEDAKRQNNIEMAQGLAAFDAMQNPDLGSDYDAQAMYRDSLYGMADPSTVTAEANDAWDSNVANVRAINKALAQRYQEGIAKGTIDPATPVYQLKPNHMYTHDQLMRASKLYR